MTAWSFGWGPSVCCITTKPPACLPACAKLSPLPFIPSISLLVFHFMLCFTLCSHLSPFSSNHPSRKYHGKPLLYCLAFYMRQTGLKQGRGQITSVFAFLHKTFPGDVEIIAGETGQGHKILSASHNRKAGSVRWKGALRRLVDVCSLLSRGAFSLTWSQGVPNSGTYF